LESLKEHLERERHLPPRPLSDDEQLLLRHVLENGPERARSFLPQILNIRAVRSCICGCPSIKLITDTEVPAGNTEGGRVLCDFEGRTAKGELIGVLLFQDDGRMTELEAYSIDGLIQEATGLFNWPLIESLKMLEWEPIPGKPNFRRPKQLS